jgi:hypothetical protein
LSGAAHAAACVLRDAAAELPAAVCTTAANGRAQAALLVSDGVAAVLQHACLMQPRGSGAHLLLSARPALPAAGGAARTTSMAQRGSSMAVCASRASMRTGRATFGPGRNTLLGSDALMLLPTAGGGFGGAHTPRTPINAAAFERNGGRGAGQAQHNHVHVAQHRRRLRRRLEALQDFFAAPGTHVLPPPPPGALTQPPPPSLPSSLAGNKLSSSTPGGGSASNSSGDTAAAAAAARLRPTLRVCIADDRPDFPADLHTPTTDMHTPRPRRRGGITTAGTPSSPWEGKVKSGVQTQERTQGLILGWRRAPPLPRQSGTAPTGSDAGPDAGAGVTAAVSGGVTPGHRITVRARVLQEVAQMRIAADCRRESTNACSTAMPAGCLMRAGKVLQSPTKSQQKQQQLDALGLCRTTPAPISSWGLPHCTQVTTSAARAAATALEAEAEQQALVAAACHALGSSAASDAYVASLPVDAAAIDVSAAGVLGSSCSSGR